MMNFLIVGNINFAIADNNSYMIGISKRNSKEKILFFKKVSGVQGGFNFLRVLHFSVIFLLNMVSACCRSAEAVFPPSMSGNLSPKIAEKISWYLIFSGGAAGTTILLL